MVPPTKVTIQIQKINNDVAFASNVLFLKSPIKAITNILFPQSTKPAIIPTMYSILNSPKNMTKYNSPKYINEKVYKIFAVNLLPTLSNK